MNSLPQGPHVHMTNCQADHSLDLFEDPSTLSCPPSTGNLSLGQKQVSDTVFF